MSVFEQNRLTNKINELQDRITKLEQQAYSSSVRSSSGSLIVAESYYPEVTRETLGIDTDDNVTFKNVTLAGYKTSKLLQATTAITTVAAGTLVSQAFKPTDQIGIRVLGNTNTGTFTFATVVLQVQLPGDAWDDYITISMDTADDDFVDTVTIEDFFSWYTTDVIIRDLNVRYNVTALTVVGDGDINISIYKVQVGSQNG